MYPKDKKTAALMSETIREVLTNEGLFEAIVKNSEKVPKYIELLPKRNGITAMATALMIKSMAGDVSAFTALSKFGFGEKVQMEVSDFYRAGKIDINVVPPPDLDGENSPAEVGAEVHKALMGDPGETVEGEIADGQEDGTETKAQHDVVGASEQKDA